MTYLSRAAKLIDNYLIARLQNRPSTAMFWYLPEPANLKTKADLNHYLDFKVYPHFYLIDYRPKLKYALTNADDIIVLPYDQPIGKQVNPEAAFQYALGLFDQSQKTQNREILAKFFTYADYFVKTQNAAGAWTYDFDWFAAKAPWSSALAQGRGACVMLRAWLLTHDSAYYHAATTALSHFQTPIAQGGFLHTFAPAGCEYFEEYPYIPTGVLNGFMSSLMCIWELHHWLQEPWLEALWLKGLSSLEKMLPYYSTGWWSLYDIDANSPVANVNSPRYHALELDYLRVLGLLSASTSIQEAYAQRLKQYRNPLLRARAFSQKLVRKVMYK